MGARVFKSAASPEVEPPFYELSAAQALADTEEKRRRQTALLRERLRWRPEYVDNTLGCCYLVIKPPADIGALGLQYNEAVDEWRKRGYRARCYICNRNAHYVVVVRICWDPRLPDVENLSDAVYKTIWATYNLKPPFFRV